MRLARKRPRLCVACAFFFYVFAGLTVSDVGSLEIPVGEGVSCPAPDPDGARSLTVLQGNLWMLPVRPLLVPYAFSTDREARLGRLVSAVRECRPDVIILQEIFERSVARLIADNLPEYHAVTSGETDFTGTVNTSGLMTLTRLPVGETRFHAFGPLASGSPAYEMIAGKGALAVDLRDGDMDLTILNVHLFGSQYPANAGAERSGQLEEVLDFVARLEREGRRVLIGGDFNIPRDELAARLPGGWAMSQHGATYDPVHNPYTVQGANDTEGNREDRRLGRGTRTIDFLLAPPDAGVTLSSRIMHSLVISDHEFLHHVVRLDRA
ncbi:MAG: endonuclease/exonuclease/phosphatase family protein [Gemmatimonadota bacterium]